MKRIPVSGGKVAVVDDEDYERLSKGDWYVNPAGYVVKATIPRAMHAMVLKAPKGTFRDHRNGNKLDNTRQNLRVCTPSESRMNSSTRKDNKTGFKGVHFHYGKWRAQIRIRGKLVVLGRFDRPEIAARTYDKAAVNQFGRFARTNFPMRFPRS